MIGPTMQCPKGIELILVDLDETVVTGGGSQVSPRVLDAITLARQCGCMAAVATGRSLSMVPEVLCQPGSMDYLICSNGSVIHDTLGGTLLDRQMQSDQVLALIDALSPLHPGWYAFIDGTSYFEWRSFSYMVAGRAPSVSDLKASAGRGDLHTGLARFARKGARFVHKGARFAKRMVFKREGRKQVASIRHAVADAREGVSKVGCSFTTAEACDRAVDAISHLGGFEVARVGGCELEITGAGVTKGTAASWLMDYLHVDRARSVAFGDSENDASLLDACGTFVAMENGAASIRDRAADVCESVDDDGVARWLERAMAQADGVAHV